MIKIGIDPVLFHLSFFSLRWYGLLVMLAVVVGSYWTYRAMRHKGMPTDPLWTLMMWAIPGGIIGSRLVHVVDQLDYYLANPSRIIGGEGQAIYGAILGGALAAWIGSRVHRLEIFPRFADLAAPSIPIAHSVGRLANIINGDATGAPTTLPWGFIYTNPNSYAPTGVATHPSPLYEILWNMVVFVVLFRFRERLKPDGALFVLYLALYSLGRFFINFSRVNTPFIGGLHQAQVISLLVLLFAIPYLLSRARVVKPGEVEEGAAGEPAG